MVEASSFCHFLIISGLRHTPLFSVFIQFLRIHEAWYTYMCSGRPSITPCNNGSREFVQICPPKSQTLPQTPLAMPEYFLQTTFIHSSPRPFDFDLRMFLDDTLTHTNLAQQASKLIHPSALFIETPPLPMKFLLLLSPLLLGLSFRSPLVPRGEPLFP